MRFRHFATVTSIALLMSSMSPGMAASTDAGWTSYNHDLAGHRYSSLTQITPDNVDKLHKICSRKMDESGSFQATPLIEGRSLYITTAHYTYSIDPQTCAVHWKNVYTSTSVEPFPVNRGVAISGNLLIRGTPDAHLIAIDKETGKTVWNVQPANSKLGEFLSAAPVVWNGLVFIGTAGSDWGVKGRMMAFDAATGKKAWTFTTIASGNDPNAKTWTTRARETGGGGTWTSYAIDPDAGEIFVPIGNPAPDFASAYRPGANLYTDSLVVLDAKTGKLKWWYQAVPHDSHDWDMAAAPVLYTSAAGTPMVAAASKDGNIYGIDRTTHKLVFKTAAVRQLNVDTPPTIKGVRICPGATGGSEWNGPAYDEKNALVIAPMDDWCATLMLGSARYLPGQFFMGGTYKFDPISTGRGTLTAVDPATGAIKWQYHSPSPMLAGVTPTAGGVTLTGDMTGNLLAFDSATGKVLFKDYTKGSIAGGVVTYSVDDKQYVAATSGNVSRLIWGVVGFPTLVIYSL